MKAPYAKQVLLVLSAAASLVLSACPLPFEYNGKNAGNSHSSDPSTPDMTAPVVVSYVVESGPSGTVTNSSYTAGNTTTVTVATASLNAVILYTDDGTAITDLRTAKKINASSGTFTVSRTTTTQSLDIHAVAVGPNMLPSPQVSAQVIVSPYPILSITAGSPSIGENGGTTSFIITSSRAPDADLTVNLLASGTYTANVDETGLPAPGPLTATLLHGTTSVSLPITGVHNPVNLSHDAKLEIQADTASPQTYSVGAPSSASVTIQDDAAHTVTYNGNGSNGGTVPTDSNSYVSGAPVTVAGPGTMTRTAYNFAGWNTAANGSGTPFAQGDSMTMGSANVTLYAQWTPMPTVATPTFSLGSGTYASAQTVTISCATGGATIRYTTDGTTPTETVGTVIASGQQVTISSYTVLNAIAYQSGWLDSAVATATYTILTSYAGPWTITNQMGTVIGVYDMVLIGTDTYHFINNIGIVFSGIYQVQGSTLVMISPDNPNYTGFVWTIDSPVHMTLTNTAYAGSIITR